MAINFIRSENGYIQQATAATGHPFTMALFVRPDDITNLQVAMQIVDLSVPIADTEVRLDVRGDVAGDPYRSVCRVRNSGSIDETANGVITQNAWAHLALVVNSSTVRTTYKDGSGTSGNGTTQNLSGLDDLNIGSFFNGAWNNSLSGQVANMAVWTAALTTTEITSLSNGFSPELIRPQSLVHFLPGVRNIQDIRRGVTLTTSGTLAAYPHPRSYF